jgi:DNA polymerase-1
VQVDAWTQAHATRVLMLMQVHDELVFEVDADFVDEAKNEVIRRMSAAAELRVPLLVEAGVGATWDEAH